MGKHIHYCIKCDRYTFDKKCILCNSLCINTNPMKYSYLDKYKSYRQIYMEYTNERY